MMTRVHPGGQGGSGVAAPSSGNAGGQGGPGAPMPGSGNAGGGGAGGTGHQLLQRPGMLPSPNVLHSQVISHRLGLDLNSFSTAITVIEMERSAQVDRYNKNVAERVAAHEKALADIQKAHEESLAELDVQLKDHRRGKAMVEAALRVAEETRDQVKVAEPPQRTTLDMADREEQLEHQQQ